MIPDAKHAAAESMRPFQGAVSSRVRRGLTHLAGTGHACEEGLPFVLASGALTPGPNLHPSRQGGVPDPRGAQGSWRRVVSVAHAATPGERASHLIGVDLLVSSLSRRGRKCPAERSMAKTQASGPAKQETCCSDHHLQELAKKGNHGDKYEVRFKRHQRANSSYAERPKGLHRARLNWAIISFPRQRQGSGAWTQREGSDMSRWHLFFVAFFRRHCALPPIPLPTRGGSVT